MDKKRRAQKCPFIYLYSQKKQIKIMTNVQLQFSKLNSQIQSLQEKQHQYNNKKTSIYLKHRTTLNNIFYPIIKSKLKEDFFFEITSNEVKVLINSPEGEEKIPLFKITFITTTFPKVSFNDFSSTNLQEPSSPFHHLSIYSYLNPSLNTPLEVSRFISISEILKTINKQQSKIILKLNNLQIKSRKSIFSKSLKPQINLQNLINNKLLLLNKVLVKAFLKSLQKFPYILDHSLPYEYTTINQENSQTKRFIVYNKVQITSLSSKNIIYSLTDDFSSTTPSTIEVTLNPSDFSLINAILSHSQPLEIEEYILKKING